MSSRTEEMLTAIADGSAIDTECICRREQYLKAIANGDATSCPNPRCREEELLLAIAEKGIGGSGSPIITEDITITPTTSTQTKTRSSGKYINKVTVTGVTSAIDSNIQASNIKKDVTILGVKGTLETGGGVTPSGTINISTNGTHNVSNYTSANVNVQPKLQEKTANENGEYVPDTGYDGFSKFNVNVESGGSGAEDLTEELTAQDTALTSLESAVDKLPEPKPDRLQWKCDNIKRLDYEFQYYQGESLDDICAGLDTSNVTNMYYTFASCNKLKSLPKLNTINVKDMRGIVTSCSRLVTVSLLDMISVTQNVLMFSYCTNLTNLTLKNIKVSLEIGSGTSWGTLLTDESLINTAKELWDKTGSTSQTLTVSTTSNSRFDAIYVKLVDATADMIAQDEYITNKKPCVVCESTDTGAMTLREYVVSKNWALA